MLINKIIFDSAVLLFGAISAGKADDYSEVVRFVNDWERLKGFCPTDIVDQLKSKVKSADTLALDMDWRVFTTTDLFVVETNFKGWITTGVICIDGVYYSQYGDRKISDYYKGVHKIVNREQLDQLIEEHNKSLITPPEEVSEEHYINMLEVLPPCRWHASGSKTYFHVSERLTGNLVNWFCSVGGKHFSFTNDASLSTEKLNEIMAGF